MQISPPSPATKPAHDLASEISAKLHLYPDLAARWVQDNFVQIGLAIAAAAALYFLLSWLRRIAAAVERKCEDAYSLKAITARTLSRTSRFFRLMLAVQLVNAIAAAPHPLGKILTMLFTIAVAIQAAIWVREIILGLVQRRAGSGEHEHDTLQTAMVLIRVLVSFAVFAIAAIFILDNLGINVTGLVAGLGVGGIAIGLAAQGIFADLFAAISVIFDKPFKRGDIIRYDTTTASVEKIGMKSTRLRALTGEEIIIANNKLLEKEITNISQLNYRRTTFKLGLICQTKPDKARALPALLEQIVEANDARFVRAGFTGFGQSTLDFELVFDVDAIDYMDTFHARHTIGLAIVEAFAAQWYEFAYPTQTTFTAAPDGTMIMPYAALPASRSVSPKK
jgi:small-conductance mechanosensitive channel